jgi:hypothetical protein
MGSPSSDRSCRSWSSLCYFWWAKWVLSKDWRSGSSYLWGQLGSSVSPRSGDVNGGKFSDIVVGASHASPGGKEYVGEAYAILGRTTFQATLDLATELDGVNGYGLIGEALSMKLVQVLQFWEM